MLTSMPVPPPAAPCTIQDHEKKIAILQQRLSALSGKEHKRERQALHKTIRDLEMDDEYVEIMKSIKECKRSQAMRQELQDTALKLHREEISKAAMLAAMSRERQARQAKVSEDQAKHELELAAAKEAQLDESTVDALIQSAVKCAPVDSQLPVLSCAHRPQDTPHPKG